MKSVIIFFIVVICGISVSAQNNKEVLVLIETNLGNLKVKLYNETPLHRDNFLKLSKTKFYDSLLFHRIIKDFMLQAGDPASKKAGKDVVLGSGGPGYTIPAEFNPNLIHKKGAIAAARQGDNVNPKKASSGSQFYIVQGRKIADDQLNQIESSINSSRKLQRTKDFLLLPENKKMKDELMKYQKEKNSVKIDSVQKMIEKLTNGKNQNDNLFKYTTQQREVYKTLGGTPFLDMNYTVFGEVVDGFDVLDKIAAVKTLPGDRPEQDVRIISIKPMK
jgi:cyclophilin family peptidyl-prolyl cis-trans isomerase